MKPLNLIIIGLLLITIGLGGIAYTKYRSTHTGTSYAQVVSERDTAVASVKAQQTVNATNITAIDNLRADKATLCAQITTAKLKQPLCQYVSP